MNMNPNFRFIKNYKAVCYKAHYTSTGRPIYLQDKIYDLYQYNDSKSIMIGETELGISAVLGSKRQDGLTVPGPVNKQYLTIIYVGDIYD